MVFCSKKNKKVERGKDDEKEVGDRWSSVAISPRSSFVVEVHHGKHTKEQIKIFLEKVKAKCEGDLPLFLSDRLIAYENIFREVFPEAIKQGKLLYAQVVKNFKSGEVDSIIKKVIFGTKEEILEKIRKDRNGKVINTSYVESRNTGYRRDNKRLARRTQCHSKKVKFHDAQIDLITGVHNYVKPNSGLSVKISNTSKKFVQKYVYVTPAMFEDLTDHVWSLRELLMTRLPKC